MKAFADDIHVINVTENFEFVLGRVENIVGKGENAGSLFQKASDIGSLKVLIVCYRVIFYQTTKSKPCPN